MSLCSGNPFGGFGFDLPKENKPCKVFNPRPQKCIGFQDEEGMMHILLADEWLSNEYIFENYQQFEVLVVDEEGYKKILETMSFQGTIKNNV